MQAITEQSKNIFLENKVQDSRPDHLSGEKKMDSFHKSFRCIAFYLPQFHPIAENDEWWGKGFTEWANVAKATPQFSGHDQPHVPADLGFYDLRLPEVRKAQAELAREYGIHGFCYYHYWFNGKLLLERPLQEVLKSGEPDLPFCLCWANENWTRAWDGGSDQILIQQNYSENDDLEHIRHLCKIFQDRRYIRVDGKPLFLVYRANSLPDPLKTTSLWREEAKKLGCGDLFLCRVESFPDEHTDPTSIGFDAAVEFQPDWAELGPKLEDEQYGDHLVYQYESVVDQMLKKEEPRYQRFPCVTPGWDNTPRRKKGATVFIDSTPQLYEKWLRKTVARLKADSKPGNILFINAWNEWGEGNHLEPDQKFGRSYLEATHRALAAEPEEEEKGLSEEAYLGIQQIFIQSGKYEEAIYALEKLLETSPDYALAHNDLGVLYTHKGNKGKALSHYEKAAFLNPENITFQKNLADLCSVGLGRSQQAIKIYRAIYAKHPHDIETHLALAKIYADLACPHDAEFFYKKALEVNPENILAKQGLQTLGKNGKKKFTPQEDPPNSIDHNLTRWSNYAWPQAGEEWSAAWGGSSNLWYGTIFPRIRQVLPAGHILEIAPGFGRCTHFLVPQCQKLTIVDLCEKCIKACQERFAAYPHISCFVNDGKSLAMIEDNSIDFVFSWDSLVHAEADVLQSYLTSLAAKLKPGGVGFFHHSNMGRYRDPRTGELSVENRHWRAPSMSSDLFQTFCKEAGLQCLAQEIIQWGTDIYNDCFSLFQKGEGRQGKGTYHFENSHFPEEMASIKKISEAYRVDSPKNRKEENPASIIPKAYLEVQQLVHNHRYDDALEELRKILNITPDNASVYCDLGVVYSKKGEKEKALDCYAKAATLAPQNPTFQKNLADFYFVELGKIQDALRHYKNVLLAQPKDLETLLITGNILASLKQFTAAEEMYQRALGVNPNNSNAIENLKVLERLENKVRSEQGTREVCREPRSQISGVKKEGMICLKPFYFMEFSTNGNISTCCPAWTKMSLGNAGDKSIDEVWNNAAAQELRRQIYRGNWQAVCKPICPHIAEYSYQNKIIKFSDLENYDFLTPQLIEEIKTGKTVLDSSPTVFNLSNSTVCNLSCIMCSRHSDTNDPELAQKTSEDVFKHLDKAKRIVLTGMGDPLARPDSRRLLLEYRGNHLKFDLITNSLLLPKYWDQIKHQNFGNLLISMDAARKETYEKIRVGGSWDTLMESLVLVKGNREKFDSITINMTVMRQNYHEIPGFVDLAATYDFNSSFQRIRGEHGDQNIFEMKDQTALEELRKIIIREQSKKRSIGVFFADLLEFGQDKSRISVEKEFSSPPPENEFSKAINSNEIKASLSKVKKANKTLSTLEKQSQSSAIKALPLTAIVSVGSKCNLNCIMCHRTIHKVPGKNLPLPLFEKAKEIFPTLEMIKLIGAGEPFLNPDYFTMLQMAKKYDLKTETVSNGTLITEEMAKKIVLSGLDSLAISLDGATANTYESVRKGAKFEKVYKNIKYLNQWKKESQITTPVLGFSTVIMKRNIEELPKLLDIAAKLGVSWITILYLTVFTKELIGESLYFHQELSNDILISFKEKAQRLGIGVDIPELFNQKETIHSQPSRKKCYEPWQMVLIETGGEVLPCCTYGEAMGNLHKNDFKEIWNNEKYQDLRRRVNGDNPPLPCRHCSNSTVAHNVNDLKAHIKCPFPQEFAINDQKLKVHSMEKEVLKERKEKVTQNDQPLKEASKGKSGEIDQVKKGFDDIQKLINDGKNEEAVIALEKVLELNPEYGLAYNDLGFLYYQRGEKAKALACYEKAVQLNPKNLTTLKNLADFYFVEGGRTEEALKIYNQILAEHPHDTETLLAFGHLCTKLSRFEDAQSFYKKALENEPRHEGAKQALEALQKIAPDIQVAKPSDKENPLVSIIIPLGDDPKYLPRCLGTVLQNTKDSKYELLFTAGYSAENLKQYLPPLKNNRIKVIFAPDNIGIVGTCNLAAEKAAGDYLVFMDRRLILSKEWLSLLLKTARSQKNCGAVSAKVIQPSVSILEAGFSLPSEGKMKGHGKGEALDAPSFSYLKEIPSGSRYCMLIPKQAWEESGRLDPHLKDLGMALIDMGLNLRAKGKNIFYQPLSVVGLVKMPDIESSAPTAIVPERESITKLRPSIIKPILDRKQESSLSPKKILVLGVYLANKLNNVDDIVATLAASHQYEVTQRWVGLGGDPPTRRVAEVTIKTLMDKKGKYEIMNELLSEEDLSQYEYVLMTDDDVVLPDQFLDQYIALQAELDFAIAQPARTRNSYIDHPLVEQHMGILARETLFVEIGPVVSFHKKIYSLLFPFDLTSSMGWGYENVWSYLIRKNKMKMGIIDNTPVDHSLRKPVENYDWSKVDQERNHFLNTHDHLPIEKCFTTLNVINLEGVRG